METKIIVTYVLCDNVIKNLKIQEDLQIKMNMAEILTTAIISAIQYSGNLEKTRIALKTERYIPNMLSKSQLNRRIHKIPKSVWGAILGKLHGEFKKHNVSNEFIVDSFPVPTCKLARQRRTKLYRERKYLGYCAAKNEYFIGFKLHMLSDSRGNPVNLQLRPASESDIGAFRKFNLNLPKNSVILADKAYNDYKHEDRLIQEKLIHLIPIRKKNSKRKSSGFLEGIRRQKRRIIETAFSCIEKLMPRSIHAVTKAGLKLKMIFFVLAYSVNQLVS